MKDVVRDVVQIREAEHAERPRAKRKGTAESRENRVFQKSAKPEHRRSKANGALQYTLPFADPSEGL